VQEETMKKLEQMYLRDLRLKGVSGIKKVFLREAKSTMNVAPPEGAPQDVVDRSNGFKQVEEWLLDTEGINLREVGGRAGLPGGAGRALAAAHKPRGWARALQQGLQAHCSITRAAAPRRSWPSRTSTPPAPAATT
jgi:hypothetical protein